MSNPFSIKLLNPDRFNKALAKKSASLSNRRATNRLALISVLRATTKNFETEGGLFNGWKPLSEITRKRRRQNDPRTLQDTGSLKNTWIVTPTITGGSLVSGVDYGIVHDKGSTKINIPRRRILPSDKMMVPIIAKIYLLHIKRSLAR